MKQLIVNADDYGLAPAVSAGIRQAHREGIVTATTALMNCPGVAAELQTAQATCPELDLGVHLVLTEGTPLLPAEQVPSLVEAETGAFPPLLPWLARADSLVPAEVAAEWRAQIETFIRATGQAPSHLDSHHHAACYTPALFTVLLTLARDYGAAIRFPLIATTGCLDFWGPYQAVWEAEVCPRLLVQAAAAPALRRPTWFEGRFYNVPEPLPFLCQLLAELPEGVTELMCHPAQADPMLSARTSYHAPRAQELAALTAPAVRAQLRAAGITLTTFAAL
jgi:predicted glycoside hydrolase/deacetylase ChbG (UPF0249 family)